MTRFEKNFHFVFVGTDAAEAIKKHSQKENNRRKRWDTVRQSEREAADARRTFDRVFTQPNNPPTRRLSKRETASEPGSTQEGYRQRCRGMRKEKKSTDPLAVERRGSVPLHLLSLLGAGLIDPFDSLPCERKSSLHLKEFLDLDLRVFSLPGDRQGFHPVREMTFSLAKESPASLAAVVACGAAWNAHPNQTQYELRAKALNAVKENLAKINNQLILAVAIMWIIEARFGNAQARRWHAEGLQKLIPAAGGFEKLDFRLQMQLAWKIIILPDCLHISSEVDNNYSRTYFNTFLLFSSNVHSLASSLASPYPSASRSLLQEAPWLYRLLSGSTPPRNDRALASKNHHLCRLTSILYIHAIFMENTHQPENLRKQLLRVRQNLAETQDKKYYTIESLAMIILKRGKQNENESLERTVLVLKLITIVKTFSVESVERLLELLWGYLSGGTFSESERARLWNAEQMEREAFQSSVSFS